MPEFRDYLVMLHSDPSDAAPIRALQQLGASVLQTSEVRDALGRARRQLRETGDSDTAVILYDLELEHATGARAASLLVSKGQVIFDDLLDAEKGMACIGRALELEPASQEAGKLLRHLEQVQAHWEQIVEKYIEEAEATTEPRLAASLYRAAAETCARYRTKTPEVERYLRKALEIDGKNKRAALQLARLLSAAGRFTELREHLESCLQVSDHSAVRNGCWLRLAQLARGPLKDAGLAIEAMQHVVAEDPANTRARALLATHYENEEDWPAVVSLYANALKNQRRSGSAETEIELLIKIGTLHWRKLEDLDAAEVYFSRLRKLVPAHRAHLGFYTERYLKNNESGKLMQLYRHALSSVRKEDPKRARELTVELAQLSEGSMNKPEKAIDSWKSILREEPDNPDALLSLRRLYEATGKWNALLDLLKDQVDKLPTKDIEGRVLGLLEVVAIYRDQLNLDVMVINTYSAILTVDPNNINVLDALAEKYRDMGRWNDLIVVLGRKCAVEGTSVSLRATLLREVASLWVDKFGNYAQAVKPLEELLSLDGEHDEAYERLKGIYTRRRQWRPLIDLLGREALGMPAAARGDQYARMADLAAKKLGDTRLAIHVWNQVLALAGALGPDEVDLISAYDALIALYEREKRIPALVEILGRKLELVRGQEQELSLLEKMGAIYIDRLHSPARAASIYEQVLTCKPNHGKAARVLREVYAAALDYDALEALYGGMGQWDELLDAYFSIADKLEDRGESIRLLERSGRIAQAEIGNPEKIARVFERLQSVESRHTGAARALVPLYRDACKWARLLSVYEILLDSVDAEEKISLIGEMRVLCEKDLGSKSLAFQWTARAFALQPQDSETLADFLRLGAETDSWRDVVDALDGRAHEADAGEEERVFLLRKLGQLAAQRLQDPVLARGYLEAVLALRSEDRDALDSLEEIATQNSEWPQLLDILRRRLALATLEQDEIALYFKIAHIEEEQREDIDAAIKSYQEIIARDPASHRALRCLARLLEGKKDWSGLAEVLQLEISVQQEADTLAALHFRLGGIYQHRLERHQEARLAFKRSLELAPSRQVQDALMFYMGAEQESSVRVEIAKHLYPTFLRAGAHGNAATALDVLIPASTGREQVLLEARLAEICEANLGEPSRAFDSAARLIRIDPADGENRKRLDRLGLELERLGDLREALEQGVLACDALGCDSSVKLRIAMEVAVLCDHVMDDSDAAIAAWREVAKLDESQEDAYRSLARLFRVAEQWPDLRSLIEARVARGCDSKEKVSLYWQLAELAEGALCDPAAAENAFRGIVDADPNQARAFDALAGYFEAAERWVELEELLGERVPYLEGSGLATSDLRRATLRAEHLSRDSEALDLVEEMLVRDASDLAARGLCEQLMGNQALAERAATVLEPLYEEPSDAEALCRVLEVLERCAQSAEQRGHLLARIARLQEEQMGTPAAAMKTWLASLENDPTQEVALEGILKEVWRLASEVDAWPEVVQGIEACLAKLSESDVLVRARLLGRCAEIQEEALADGAAAIGLYERQLALNTSDPDVIQSASVALDRLYAGASEFAKQVRVLRDLVPWTESSDERVTLLTRIAEIEEVAIEDAEAALAGWEAVLEEDAENSGALLACERLLEATDSFEALVEIVRRRVDAMESVSDRSAGLRRLAKLHYDRLSQPSEAISCLIEVLDLGGEQAGVLEQLSDLYRKEQCFEELLDSLERRLRDCDDGERVDLLFESGVILADALQRPTDAIEFFDDVLRIDHEHAQARERVVGYVSDVEMRERAAELLQPIYESGGEHHELISLLQTLCKDNDDSRAVMSHLLRISDIYERDLGDLSAAFEALTKAALGAPAEPELEDMLSDLQRLASENNSFEALIEVYRDIAPGVFDSGTQRGLYLDIADLSQAVLKDVDTARRYYEMVLESEPDDTRALGSLEAICRKNEDHLRLYELLVHKSELDDASAGDRAAALAEAGALCWEHLDRISDAAVHWEQVLALIPADRAVATKLQELYRRSERWHDLAEALESRLGFAETVEEAVDLRWRLGVLHEEQLGDLDSSVENYGAAIGGDPGHRGAFAALERLLDRDETRSAVADILEPIHVAQHNWAQLVRIYEIKLEVADAQEERLAITKYIARLYEEQLEDLDGAFRWLGRVFRESPGDRNVRMQLERLGGVLEDWEGLAKVYQEYLDEEGVGASELRPVAKTLAELYNERLGSPGKALAAYRSILQLDPDDLAIFGSAETMLLEGADWASLVVLYEEIVHSCSDDLRRQQIYEKLAGVQEEHLDDNGRAVDAWRALLEINPESIVSQQALERLLEVQQDWYELVELLSAQIENPADEGRLLESRMRLASVRENKLDDVEAAISQYEEALLLPNGDIALTELERLVVDDGYRERIAGIIEPLYRERDWWQKLVVILDVQVAFAGDSSSKGELLKEIAAIHEERGGDLELALDALGRAWLEDTGDEALYERFLSLGHSLGSVSVLLKVLEQGLVEQYDSELAGKVLIQLASIHERHDDNNLEAVACLRRVLEVRDDHALALFKLDRLLVQLQDWDALVPILSRRAELADSEEDQLSLLQRLASLHEEKRGDRASAISAYQNLLEAKERDENALDSLDRLFRAQENWRELSLILLTKVEVSDDPSVIRGLHFELAELQEDKLKDVYEAISQMRAILDLDPDDARGLLGLRRLLESEGMWQDLLEVMDHQAHLASGPDKVSRTFASALLVEEHLEDLRSAIERYAVVLELSREHEGARSALRKYSQGTDGGGPDDVASRACEILEQVHRLDGDFDSLAEVLETRLRAAIGEPEMQLPLLAQLAELHEGARSDLGSAFSCWSRALRLNLEHQEECQEAQGHLERLAEALGGWPDLVALYNELRANALDSSVEYICAWKAGEIYEKHLGSLAEASACYEVALGVADDEEPVLLALARVYEASGDFSELSDVYSRQVDASLDELEQANLLFKLGEVRELRLQKAEDAVGAYRDALDRDSTHHAARGALERLLASSSEASRIEIIAILEPLYEEDGDSVRLAYVLSTKVGVVQDRYERAQIYRRLAQLAEHELGDATRALDAVGGWLAEEPESEQALEELERLGLLVDRPSDVVARLDGIFQSSDDREIQIRLGRKSASIKMDLLNDTDGALLSAEAIVMLDPDDEVALEVIAQVARLRGDWPKLATTQHRRAGLCYEPVLKRQLLVETAHLQQQLELPEECIWSWRAVLDIDACDVEALRALAGLYRGQQEWAELVEMLLALCREESDLSIERALRVEVAEIYSESLDNLDQGVDAWQAVLQIDQSGPPAMALQSLDALELLHLRREDFMAVQEVLLQRADVVESGDDKIAVYLRLAQLAELERDAPEESVDFLRSALEMNPGQVQAGELIERLLRGLERWHEVVELLETRAETLAVLDDVTAELRCLAQAAEIWESHLDNPDEAAQLLEKILARDPNSVAALTRLAKIYEAASDWERCGVVLERALALGPQGTDAADLYVRLGEVAINKDGDQEKAQGFFGQALYFDGYHPLALERVEESAREKEDWILVADMVRRRYEICKDAAKRIELTIELAHLYGERLAQPEQVIPLLEAAYALSPDDARIARPLADLYFHAARYAEAVPMLETLAVQAKKKRRMKEVAGYRQRLAGILAAQGEIAKAITAYEEAFRIDPTNVRTMIGLGKIYMTEQDWDKARRVYRSMVLQTIDPEIGITKADVYFQLGKIHEAKEEIPKAKDMYRRALSTDASHKEAKAVLEALS